MAPMAPIAEQSEGGAGEASTPPASAQAQAPAAVDPNNEQITPSADDPIVDRELRRIQPAQLRLDSFEDQLMRARIRSRVLGGPSVGESIRVGRFELIAKLGAGGMGTVWSAHDPHLDRTIALKFLRSHLDRHEDERLLLTEAQALAQIRHPNVITVYDAGQHEGRVWIAMERVEGETLRQWTARGPSRRRIVEAWSAAGRGLAAIHRAGLVHRDIKPDNVLIAADGRVQLIDFGLVRGVADRAETDRAETVPTSAVPEAASDTEPRAFAGTPAYAAPEQRRGEAVDARADQYAFCVGLWEALAGERPPAGAGRLRPRRRTVLRRGLAEQPSERFADMDALLAALAPRRTRWAIMVGIGAAALAFGLGTRLEPRPATDGACSHAGEAIDEQWSPTTRTALRGRLGDRPVLADVAEQGLDAWADQWRAAARSACQRDREAGLSSPANGEGQRRCLDAQRSRFAIAIERAAAVEDGPALLGVLAGLESPGACLGGHADALAGLTPAELEAHWRLDATLARLRHEPRVDARRARATEVAIEARETGLDAVEARAALFLAREDTLTGRPAPAEAWLRRALELGERLDDPALQARAWLELANVSVDLRFDLDEAEFRWRRAGATVERLPEPHRLRGLSAWIRGRIHLGAGELEQAARRYDQAIAEYAALGPTAGLELGLSLRQRALVAARRGRAAEAERLLERARAAELREAAPAGGYSRGIESSNEGLAQLDAGDLERAQATLERARAELERERGPSLALANTLVALSATADGRGDIASARAYAQQADALVRSVGGPDHFDRFYTLSAIGVAAFRERDFEGADAAFGLALRVAEEHYPPGSTELAMPAVNYAEARLALGHALEAEALLDDAIAGLSASLPPTHPDFAVAFKALGAVHLERGRVDEARRVLERALAIHLASDPDSLECAQTRWLLARAQWRAGTRASSHEQARAAIETLTALGPDWAWQAAEIEAWTSTHPSEEQQ